MGDSLHYAGRPMLAYGMPVLFPLELFDQVSPHCLVRQKQLMIKLTQKIIILYTAKHSRGKAFTVFMVD